MTGPVNTCHHATEGGFTLHQRLGAEEVVVLAGRAVDGLLRVHQVEERAGHGQLVGLAPGVVAVGRGRLEARAQLDAADERAAVGIDVQRLVAQRVLHRAAEEGGVALGEGQPRILVAVAEGVHATGAVVLAVEVVHDVAQLVQHDRVVVAVVRADVRVGAVGVRAAVGRPDHADRRGHRRGPHLRTGQVLGRGHAHVEEVEGVALVQAGQHGHRRQRAHTEHGRHDQHRDDGAEGAVLVVALVRDAHALEGAVEVAVRVAADLHRGHRPEVHPQREAAVLRRAARGQQRVRDAIEHDHIGAAHGQRGPRARPAGVVPGLVLVHDAALHQRLRRDGRGQQRGQGEDSEAARPHGSLRSVAGTASTCTSAPVSASGVLTSGTGAGGTPQLVICSTSTRSRLGWP